MQHEHAELEGSGASWDTCTRAAGLHPGAGALHTQSSPACCRASVWRNGSPGLGLTSWGLLVHLRTTVGGRSLGDLPVSTAAQGWH